MNHMIAHIHMRTGHGGNRLMMPRYMASVAGNDKTARTYLTYGI